MIRSFASGMSAQAVGGVSCLGCAGYWIENIINAAAASPIMVPTKTSLTSSPIVSLPSYIAPSKISGSAFPILPQSFQFAPEINSAPISSDQLPKTRTGVSIARSFLHLLQRFLKMLLTIPDLPKLVRHITFAPFLSSRDALATGDAAFGVEVW